jgi:hypothetical protein
MIFKMYQKNIVIMAIGMFFWGMKILLLSCLKISQGKFQKNLVMLTFSAKCLHKRCIKGTCFSQGAKSKDMRYNNLVFCLDDGKQT